MIHTVTFNPSVDYIVHIPSVTVGVTNRSLHEELYFGGKGINVSCVLRELGVSSVAHGFKAGFTGQAIEDHLRSLDIATHFIPLPRGNSRINVKLSADCETEINGQGPDIPSDALKELISALSQLREGDTLVLAGSIPSSLPQDTYETILKIVSAKSIRCVVDASGELLVNTLSYHPFLVKPNLRELEDIFSVKIVTMHDVERYGSRLLARGAQNVLVSMGCEGALLIDGDGLYYGMPALPVQTVNTVGAGDSMVAGFLAGYDKSGDPEEALRLGTVCGAATASLPGLATKETIDALASAFANH